MRFFGGFGGWLRVSGRYSARGWRNGQTVGLLERYFQRAGCFSLLLQLRF
nr:MAG TPA: hypothetical protein [Caudoviricetes sp.]